MFIIQKHLQWLKSILYVTKVQQIVVASKRNCNCSPPFKDMARAVVSTAQGKLKGCVEQLNDATPYYSFKGVPYAEPPVGKLRFKAPLPPKPWSGIYDATEHKGVCPQLDFATFQLIVEGNEDCLFLNIYTKSLNNRKPVMVFIHGGAFMSGSGDSDMFGPKYLLKHDVVLVTINYRLELLGFLNLEIPDVPGNAGMKDQVAALKWVKNNIENFGGDPNNITIFGESAGAVSVTHHLISPMSKGLFDKAISQSGVGFNFWAINHDVKERSFRAGKYLGKVTTDPYELLDYLQSLPAKDLVKITFKTMHEEERYKGIPLYFTPVIEKKFDNVEAFIDREPLDVIMSGDFNSVPLVAGYNESEGLMMFKSTLNSAKIINENMHYRLPRDLSRILPEDLLKSFGDRIRKFYFNDKDLVNQLDKVIDLETDVTIAAAIHRFLYFYAKKSKTPCYMYKFNFDTDINFTKKMLGVSSIKGASHADDIFYLFSSDATKDVYEEEEDVRTKVDILTKLWTDFAKTGNPTPSKSSSIQWAPYTHESKPYLHLGDEIALKRYADKERVEFWDKMYADAGLPYMSKSSL